MPILKKIGLLQGQAEIASKMADEAEGLLKPLSENPQAIEHGKIVLSGLRVDAYWEAKKRAEDRESFFQLRAEPIRPDDYRHRKIVGRR